MRAVNLIPEDQRSGGGVGAGRSKGGAYAVLALVAGIALLALLYGIARHQVSSRRAEAAALSAQAQGAQQATSRLAPYTSFMSLRQQREQAVAQLVDTRFDWAHAFHELGRVLPVSISVTSLTGQVGSAGGGSSGAPATGAGSTISSGPASPAAKSPKSSSVSSATPPGTVPSYTLSGCASTQQAVAMMLNRLRLIDGVSEVSLQSSTKSAAGAAAGAGAGGCPKGTPAFTVQVSFDPLPNPGPAGGPVQTPAANVSPAGASANPTGGTK